MSEQETISEALIRKGWPIRYSGRAQLQCGCCQKVREGDDLHVFGTLTDAGGKEWDVCGKCIQVMWRKRAPRPDPIGM